MLTICSVVLMSFKERIRPSVICAGRTAGLQVVNHEAKSVSQTQYAI